MTTVEYIDFISTLKHAHQPKLMWWSGLKGPLSNKVRELVLTRRSRNRRKSWIRSGWVLDDIEEIEVECEGISPGDALSLKSKLAAYYHLSSVLLKILLDIVMENPNLDQLLLRYTHDNTIRIFVYTFGEAYRWQKMAFLFLKGNFNTSDS